MFANIDPVDLTRSPALKLIGLLVVHTGWMALCLPAAVAVAVLAAPVGLVVAGIRVAGRAAAGAGGSC